MDDESGESMEPIGEVPLKELGSMHAMRFLLAAQVKVRTLENEINHSENTNR